MSNMEESNKIDNKFISVVIPTHNRANLIERAVNSVLEQTYQNFEINVISDGSRDDTDIVMEHLMEKDPRINYFSYTPSKGANYARNLGIDQSQYDFIAFLDDDDEWMPNKLENQLRVFSENEDIGVVCTAYINQHIDIGKSTLFTPSAPLNSSKEILMRNCIGSTTTVMLKKALLSVSGKFDPNLKAMQDYDLWIRLCQITRVGVVQEPSVNYYISHKNNQISNNTNKYMESILYIENKYMDLFSKLNKKDSAIRNNNNMLRISKKGITNGQPKIAFKYAIKALRYKINTQTLLCLMASLIPYNIIVKIRSR